MTVDEAREMLAPATLWGGEDEHWADLGCGRGTFTRALANLLGAGSSIAAVDEDHAALASLPSAYDGIRIEPRHSTLDAFAANAPLHGILIANALHYVSDPAPLLDRWQRMLVPRGRLLLVEYDTDTPVHPWVPHPVSRRRSEALLNAAGFEHVRHLADRPSIYGRSALYSLAGSRPTQR